MLSKQWQDQLDQHITDYINQQKGNISKGGGAAGPVGARQSQAAIDATIARYKEIPGVMGDKDIANPQQLELAKRYVTGNDAIAKQQLTESLAGQTQLEAQNKQLAEFRNQLEKQSFGGTGLNLQQALTSTGGDIGNLNQFLGQQEAQTFNTQLKPLIQMALGARGLSDSGAQVELQSKALAQLEQQRQQSMMQAALGARSQIQGLGRQDVLGDIGYQQQMQNNQFDLGRANVTLQFQQQLEKQREELAMQLSQRQGGGNSPWGAIGMGLGTAVGGGLGAFGGPAGAMAGASIGGSLGGALGGGLGGYNPNNASLNAIPGALGAGSSFFSNQVQMPKAQSIPQSNYYQPGYGQPLWR